MKIHEKKFVIAIFSLFLIISYDIIVYAYFTYAATGSTK